VDLVSQPRPCRDAMIGGMTDTPILFFKALPPGTHPEVMVRKDGVTQRYNVANAAPEPAGQGAQDPDLTALLKQYAGDAEVSPAELAEAVRQYREVESRYRGTSGWLKAPNGQPSNLNERQWVLTRTPNFKRWFGDFEGLARQQFEGGLIGRALNDRTWQARTLIAEGYAADPSGKLSETFGFSLVKQYLSPDDVRKTDKRHGIGNERRQDQVAMGQDDYVKALEVLRDPDTFKKTISRNGKPSAEFGRAFSDGTYVVAEVEIAEPGAVSVKSAWKKIPGRTHEGATAFPRRTSVNAAGVTASISSGTLLVNLDAVSKVVDANGEPSVVYHGGTATTVFDTNLGPDKGSRGAFFGSDMDAARRYARRHGESGTVTDAFLRIVMPYQSPLFYDASRDRAKADAANADGVIVAGGEQFVVFHPEQIKSAIGNAGTFRPDLGHLNKAMPIVKPANPTDPNPAYRDALRKKLADLAVMQRQIAATDRAIHEAARDRLEVVQHEIDVVSRKAYGEDNAGQRYRDLLTERGRLHRLLS
jgi:hypothetical protein